MVWQPCCWESVWSNCGNEMIMMLILFLLLCRWDDRDDHGQAKQAAKMLGEVLQDQPSQVRRTTNIINLDSSFRGEYLLRSPKNASLNEQNILRSPGWIQSCIWPLSLSSIYCTEYWILSVLLTQLFGLKCCHICSSVQTHFAAINNVCCGRLKEICRLFFETILKWTQLILRSPGWIQRVIGDHLQLGFLFVVRFPNPPATVWEPD